MTTEAVASVSPFSAAPVRSLDTPAVKKAIPHRYPFLLIDRIDVIQEEKYCVGTKMVTANEHYFEGHFPGQPVMPGVLIIESMAQTACAMLLSKGGLENKIAFFMGIDEAKFRAPVTPGCVTSITSKSCGWGAPASSAARPMWRASSPRRPS